MPINENHYFAITLDKITVPRFVDQNEDNFWREFLLNQAEWLNCLVQHPNVCFDLRFICQPSAHHFKKGKIKIVLLGKIESICQLEASQMAHNILDICRTFFENLFEFSIIEDTVEIEKLRIPFTINSIGEIFRRVGKIKLDTFQSEEQKLALGFVKPPVLTNISDSLMHIYPFLYNPTSLEKLFKLMLMQKFPTAICFSLQPTTLLPAEIQFLEKQIKTCETFAQTGIYGGDNLAKISPTLQERARIMQRYLTTKLFGLKSSAVLLRCRLVGEKTIPASLLNVLGSNLTLPCGGLGTPQLENFLYGGYQTNIYETTEHQTQCEELENLNFSPSLKKERDRFRLLFQTKEASDIFTLPVFRKDEFCGIATQKHVTRQISANIETDGVFIGTSHHNGSSLPVRLDDETRRRHVYAVGQTGTGKSTLFESMILSDIRQGKGLCLIDPHGQLAEQLLYKIPSERADDLIYFDAGDTERTFGINILEYKTENQKHFLIQEILAIIKRLVREYDPAIVGPVFFQHSRMVLQLVMSNPDKIGTLLQFYQVFCTDDFYRNFLPLKTEDILLKTFVEGTLSKTDYTKQFSDSISMGTYISSKYEPFFGDPMLRNIFGQKRSTISFEEIINNNKILIVNLSKGKIGELNSQFLGMILIAKFQSAAMNRAYIKEEKRDDFYLYVDEFQNLATENFNVLLAEARKYRLNLALTNQFVSQLSPSISEAIAGNVGTTIAFRVGFSDAQILEQQLRPTFNRYDLMNLPNFNAYISTLSNHEVCPPFSLKTAFDQTVPNLEFGEELRERSRKIYGRKKQDVMREIEESLFLTETEIHNELKSYPSF